MSKSPIRSVKGTQDILPDQSSRWQDLELTIQKIMDRYGYKEIRTPAFENTEVFLRGVGQETDIVSKEMYSWTDQGGNNLTLKPELTAPVVRSFIQHNLGQINSINKLSNRTNINLCIDGGISNNNIINIDCDKIVSASNVFNNINPKKQIINLQNLLNN